ncbi:MAG: T9SS type A sorting domain-containing protein [bacterium]|nr:T9SS type A sorting domain-containing protein [bacterium]
MLSFSPEAEVLKITFSTSNRRYTMNQIKIFLLFFPILITSSIAQTFIPPGDVSGDWSSAGSPYYIQGEITIPNGETLTIGSGVSVVFMGHYKFNVQGRLLAVGTQQDSINFTADSVEIGWHGIRFNYTPNTNDTSKLIYCSFRYGKANTGVSSSWDRCGGAILIGAFDKVFVSDCLFEYNSNSGDITALTGGAAIFIKSASPIIVNSTFRNTTGTTDCAILSLYSSINNPGENPILSNNVFANNSGPHGPITCCYNDAIISGNFISENVTTRAGGGIFTMTTNAIITNNIIINNQSFGVEGEGGGIKCYIGDKSIFINNTIAFNSSTLGGGICCNQNSDPVFINNIIWGNTATNGNQVNLIEATSDPNFFYCDIQGGKESFGGAGAGNNYTGLYENNMDSDPMFRDTANFNYHLMSTDCGSTFNSPCIDAGDPDFSDSSLHCIWGLGTDRSDIGAFGGGEIPLAVDDQNTEMLTDYSLSQNYPNPLNPSTVISYQLPVSCDVTLKVFDVLGNEIATLINEEKPAGRYEVEFNTNSHSGNIRNLPSGVYFYQLKAGNYIGTKKMLLLK